MASGLGTGGRSPEASSGGAIADIVSWRLAALAWLARLQPRRVVSLAVALSGAVALIGALVSVAVDPEHPWLGLDAELQVPSLDRATVALPALWACALLLGAAAAWVAAARAWEPAFAQAVATAFGLGLAFLAVDELMFLHERLEKRLGVDWQLLYAPGAVVFGSIALLLIRQVAHLDRRAAYAIAAGCACWAGAQLLELLQWVGDEPVSAYLALMIPEEVAEMAGSILIGLAALLVARARMAPTEDPRVDAAAPVAELSTRPGPVIPGAGDHTLDRPPTPRAVLVGSLAASGALVFVILAAGMLAGEGDAIFLDTYEAAGSRLAGIGSNIGVMLWAAIASICLFGAGLAARDAASRPWWPMLAGSGLLALVLLADDYLSLHELVDDAAISVAGLGESTLLRNASELLAFGLLGLGIAAYLVAFRSLLARTEIGLLIVAGMLFACSLAIDMLPRSWLAAVPVPTWLWDPVEDGLKLAGIVLFASYYVRTTAMVLSRRPVTG